MVTWSSYYLRVRVVWPISELEPFWTQVSRRRCCYCYQDSCTKRNLWEIRLMWKLKRRSNDSETQTPQEKMKNNQISSDSTARAYCRCAASLQAALPWRPAQPHHLHLGSESRGREAANSVYIQRLQHQQSEDNQKIIRQQKFCVLFLMWTFRQLNTCYPVRTSLGFASCVCLRIASRRWGLGSQHITTASERTCTILLFDVVACCGTVALRLSVDPVWSCMILLSNVILAWNSQGSGSISQLRLPQRALHASKSCVRTPAAPRKLHLWGMIGMTPIWGRWWQPIDKSLRIMGSCGILNYMQYIYIYEYVNNELIFFVTHTHTHIYIYRERERCIKYTVAHVPPIFRNFRQVSVAAVPCASSASLASSQTVGQSTGGWFRGEIPMAYGWHPSGCGMMWNDVEWLFIDKNSNEVFIWSFICLLFVNCTCSDGTNIGEIWWNDVSSQVPWRKSMQVTPEERVKTEVIYGLILGWSGAAMGHWSHCPLPIRHVRPIRPIQFLYVFNCWLPLSP